MKKTVSNPSEPSFPQRVYGLVAQVPEGKVVTYGLLALMAGSPRASRIVGAAMARAPEGLPCHRVIYSDGRMCCFDAFGGADIQREMLRREGVVFLPDGRVDLKKCLWAGEDAVQE